MNEVLNEHQSTVLYGKSIRLEPLGNTHQQGLINCVSDGELWMIKQTMVPFVHEIPAFIDSAVTHRQQCKELPFAIINLATEEVVGSTRFMAVNLRHRRTEIGYTFLSASAQGTGVNEEAKLLMLDFAFHKLDCRRVEFLTDSTNIQSQKALEKLGAEREGLLKQHMILRDGYSRDSLVYAIFQQDWPLKKKALLSRMPGYCRST